MNAVVVDRAEMLREAHAALHMAMEMGVHVREALRAEFTSLGDALKTYQELDGNALHWEVIFPHLSDEADPDGEALRKAADEVEAAAEDLIRVMAAYCGTEDETKNAAGVTA